jgi:Domain of unknown function (DUF1932)
VTTVTLLHPGRMGAPFAAQARRGGATVLWCPAGRSEATRRRAAQAGLLPAPTLAEVGTASALKMAFGSYQKGARTLAAVSHALAAAFGLTEALTNEGKRMASPILADLDYLPSVAARAWRWAPELAEAAQTLHQLDLPPDLAQATAAVLHRWDTDRDQFDLPAPEVLDHLRTRRPPATDPTQPPDSPN